MIQRDDGWHDARRTSIGGSDAAAVCGKSRYQTPLDVWRRKRGDAPPVPDTDDMRRGLMLEPVALAQLRDHDKQNWISGEEAMVGPYGMIGSDQYPWAHVTPDAVCYESFGKKYAEIKIPRHARWLQYRMYGLPEEWIIQCMHGMAVTGAPEWTLWTWSPETVRGFSVTIPRDSGLISDMMRIEESFMRSVESGDPPTQPQQPIAAAAEIPPEARGKIMRIQNGAISAAAEAYWTARELSHDAEDLLQNARDQLLREAAGIEAWEVKTSGGDRLRFYHRTMPGREILDTERLKLEYPDIYNKCKKIGKQYDKLSVYRISGKEDADE